LALLGLKLRTFTAKEASKNPMEHGKFTGKFIKAEISHKCAALMVIKGVTKLSITTFRIIINKT
jgi:hypothetical protein